MGFYREKLHELISGDITASGGIGTISVGVDITGDITDNGGDIYTVSAGRDIAGQVDAGDGELHAVAAEETSPATASPGR